jgi:hypothetical protein
MSPARSLCVSMWQSCQARRDQGVDQHIYSARGERCRKKVNTRFLLGFCSCVCLCLCACCALYSHMRGVFGWGVFGRGISFTRLPFVASEIFTCQIQNLLDAVFADENTHLLDHLFTFLDQPRPLQAAAAGFFRKVMHVFCTSKYEEVLCVCVPVLRNRLGFDLSPVCV